MNISILSNGNQKVAVESIEGKSYYQLEINQENKVGNWKFNNPISFKDSKIKIIDNTSTPFLAESIVGGCGSLPFYQCMNCLIIGICGSDWVCTIACGLAIPSCLAGAAAVCIFTE